MRKNGAYKAAFFCLAAALLLAGCGKADDSGSGQERTESSAEEKAEYVGGVYADPVANGTDYQAPAGTDTVAFYVEREGVEPGNGVLILYDDKDDSILAEIPADSSQVAFAPVSEEHKIRYGMDRGTEVQVSLGFGLEAGKRYYIMVTQDFVRYGSASSRALGGKTEWPVQVEADPGGKITEFPGEAANIWLFCAREAGQ